MYMYTYNVHCIHSLPVYDLLRNRETGSLMKQIEMMKGAVAREEEKAYDLEIKSKSVQQQLVE